MQRSKAKEAGGKPTGTRNTRCAHRIVRFLVGATEQQGTSKPAFYPGLTPPPHEATTREEWVHFWNGTACVSVGSTEMFQLSKKKLGGKEKAETMPLPPALSFSDQRVNHQKTQNN